jgi:hypothetical protein
MYPEKTVKQIEFEIIQIDKLLHSYMPLFEECKINTPDLFNITAMSSVLHSFYNGVEKILIFIAKDIDKKEPDGSRWHADLLLQMNESSYSRGMVISQDMKNSLMDYMAFRHFFRHSYSFTLRWPELQPLVSNIFDVWNDLKKQITEFLEK